MGDNLVRKLLHKLEGRARLQDLAGKPEQKTPQERELERLRSYLAEWREHCQRYHVHLGHPSGASWVSKMSDEIRTASEYLERSDRWAMEQVEKAVMEDLLRRDDGEAMRAAVLNRLMNHRLPVRVFRSGRLAGIAVAEVDALADRAERELVAISKRRGLPL